LPTGTRHQARQFVHVSGQFAGSPGVFAVVLLHQHQVLQDVADGLRGVDLAVFPLLQEFTGFIRAHLTLLLSYIWYNRQQGMAHSCRALPETGAGCGWLSIQNRNLRT
jgi:hypothetical protein